MTKKDLDLEEIDYLDFMLRYRGPGVRFQEDRWPEYFFIITDLYTKEFEEYEVRSSIEEIINILCDLYKADPTKTHLRYAITLKLKRDLDL